MTDFLNSLNSSPYLNLLFLVLTVFSIILAIFFYFKSNKKKELVYDISSASIVENKFDNIDGIKIIYKDKNITRLTATKISIWNKGLQTINRQDIAKGDPLRIVLDDSYDLLDFKTDFEKSIANEFKLTKKGNAILIDFAFIDTNDGIIITIYHNGENSSDIGIIGKIIGMEEVTKFNSNDTLLIDWMQRNTFDKYPENTPKFISFLLLPIVLILVAIGLCLLMFDGLFVIFKRLKYPKQYDLRKE